MFDLFILFLLHVLLNLSSFEVSSPNKEFSNFIYCLAFSPLFLVIRFSSSYLKIIIFDFSILPFSFFLLHAISLHSFDALSQIDTFSNFSYLLTFPLPIGVIYFSFPFLKIFDCSATNIISSCA